MWRVIDFKLAWPFVIGGLAGMPIGALLVARADPQHFKLSVGAMLLVFPAALFFIRKPMAFSFGGRAADAAVGFAGGILGGLAGLSGPLPTLWASVRGWTKDQRRGVFQIFNGTVLGAALLLQIASGFVKPEVFWLALLAHAGHADRRTDRHARLSGAERPQFLRRRARPAVSVRARTGVEQHWHAVALRWLAWPPCGAIADAVRCAIKLATTHVMTSPSFLARTSRPVAGLCRHGDLRRHAAGDADCGIGN